MSESTNLLLFLCIVIIIIRAAGFLTKIGQPSLLGELCGGMLLALLGYFHFAYFDTLSTNSTLAFLSELGGIFLLFEIGLDSDIKLLKQNGAYALMIAVCGAALPFAMGYAFAGYFVNNASTNFCLFIAASLAATSTGISVRIFKEYNMTKSRACQVVLAASVIDDIISLVVLTCITALVTTGHFSGVSLLLILLRVSIFFAVLYFGIRVVLPYFLKGAKKENSLDIAIILATCFAASLFAHQVGLSSILGAFLAGLLINKDYFNGKHHLIYPFVWLFVPIFFIYSGLQIDINSLLDLKTLGMALGLSLLAIISKILPPLLIPNKSDFLAKLAIGFGMVPRGEIGLVIALIGKEIGVLNNYYFNIVTLMVVITSFAAPLMLNGLIQRMRRLPKSSLA